MSVRFINVKSKEVVTAESEPHIAAMWASSDRSPNITQGQDFGWRLHPEIVAELEDYKRDPDTLERVARLRKKETNELTEYDILFYISERDNANKQKFDDNADYTDDYEVEVRAAKRARATAGRKDNLDIIDDESATPVVADPAALSDEELLAELERRTGAAELVTTTTTTSAPAKAK